MGIVGGLAFCLWVIVAFFLYIRLPPGRATIWNFLGAQMLLPTGFYSFPMILPINKGFIPTVCAAVGIWILSPLSQKVRPKFGLASSFLILYLIAPIVSALANADPVVVGDHVLPEVGITTVFQLPSKPHLLFCHSSSAVAYLEALRTARTCCAY